MRTTSNHDKLVDELKSTGVEMSAARADFVLESEKHLETE